MVIAVASVVIQAAICLQQLCSLCWSANPACVVLIHWLRIRGHSRQPSLLELPCRPKDIPYKALLFEDGTQLPQDAQLGSRWSCLYSHNLSPLKGILGHNEPYCCRQQLWTQPTNCLPLKIPFSKLQVLLVILPVGTTSAPGGAML